MQMELLLAADSSTRQSPSLDGPKPDGQSERTSPVCSAAMKGATLLQWLESWLGSGLTFRETAGERPVWHLASADLSNGQLWMRNIAEWTPTLEPSLSGGDVCSLSEILETGPVDRRYFLSPKACAGILRRAEDRGKDLPTTLHQALQAVAEEWRGVESPEDKIP